MSLDQALHEPQADPISDADFLKPPPGDAWLLVLVGISCFIAGTTDGLVADMAVLLIFGCAAFGFGAVARWVGRLVGFSVGGRLTASAETPPRD